MNEIIKDHGFIDLEKYITISEEIDWTKLLKRRDKEKIKMLLDIGGYIKVGSVVYKPGDETAEDYIKNKGGNIQIQPSNTQDELKDMTNIID